MEVKAFVSLIARHRPALWIIVAAVALGLAETGLSLLIPLLTSSLVDQVAASALELSTIVVLGTIFVVQTAMSGFSVYSMSYVGQYVIGGVRRELWERVLRLPVPFFDRNTSGETMSRVTNDTNVIKDFIVGHVISFLGGIVSIIGGVGILLYIDWRMTLLMLAAVPVSLLVLWPLGSRMFKISKAMQDETALFQGDLGRVLSEIRLVKASLAEPVEARQGQSRIAGLFRFGLKEAKIMSVVTPMMMTVMLLVLVLLIGYGGVRVAQGLLSTGELVAIILYMFQIVMPFTQMASFFTQFQKAMGASQRIIELMEEPLEAGAAAFAAGTGTAGADSEAREDDKRKLGASAGEREEGRRKLGTSAGEREEGRRKLGASAGEREEGRRKLEAGTGEREEGRRKLEAGDGELSFSQVGFAYSEERPILREVSFSAVPGGMTAFVGPSGTGKTTLFSLIERFYEPGTGRIEYNGEPITDMPLTEWRMRIAYVSQDSPMMAGSIRHNLTYGLVPGTVGESRIAEALESANLAEFVASLPDGLETEVGERGVKLSGGQRQRLAIARALLRDPEILLLDEATAHLDSESEKLVQEALLKLMQFRTTLVIAHRLSTIASADRIIVLEKGEVTGQGTHAELLQSHELYAKLVKGQLLGNEAAAALP